MLFVIPAYDHDIMVSSRVSNALIIVSRILQESSLWCVHNYYSILSAVFLLWTTYQVDSFWVAYPTISEFNIFAVSLNGTLAGVPGVGRAEAAATVAQQHIGKHLGVYTHPPRSRIIKFMLT